MFFQHANLKILTIIKFIYLYGKPKNFMRMWGGDWAYHCGLEKFIRDIRVDLFTKTLLAWAIL